MSLYSEMTDIELLKKTIHILSCVIHGHSIRALLRKDTRFFSKATNADLLSIYIQKDKGHKIDFLSDKKHLFCSLMNRYGFNRHSPNFTDVGNEIVNYFSYSKPYKEVTDLYVLLKGTVTKKKCMQMSEEIMFNKALFFPLQLHNGKKIGFVAYFYTRNNTPDMKKLSEVSGLIQGVIEPLYDTVTSTFYTKCAQVDSEMSRLTGKEKEIVQRVLRGMTYKEIAEDLRISINTLKSHIKNIFSKYGVNSKIELNNKLLMHMR